MHLASTYVALCLLIVTGDMDFEHVNKEGLLEYLGEFQTENGCFRMLPSPSDGDLRACYCGAAISFMLQTVLNRKQKQFKIGFD